MEKEHYLLESKSPFSGGVQTYKRVSTVHQTNIIIDVCTMDVGTMRALTRKFPASSFMEGRDNALQQAY